MMCSFRIGVVLCGACACWCSTPTSARVFSVTQSPRDRFFDHHAIELIRQRVDNIPSTANCGLFMEIEHDGEPDLDAWFEVFERVDALVDDIIAADDDESRQRLYAVRHAIPAGVNEIVVRNGMPKVGTDFAVPDHALGAMMALYNRVSMKHVFLDTSVTTISI